MTAEYFQHESRRLREVLKDACDRGDIYLEYDVREALVKLQEKYYNDESDDSAHN